MSQQNADSTLIIGIDGDTKDLETALSKLDKVGVNAFKKLAAAATVAFDGVGATIGASISIGASLGHDIKGLQALGGATGAEFEKSLAKTINEQAQAVENLNESLEKVPQLVTEIEQIGELELNLVNQDDIDKVAELKQEIAELSMPELVIPDQQIQELRILEEARKLKEELPESTALINEWSAAQINAIQEGFEEEEVYLSTGLSEAFSDAIMGAVNGTYESTNELMKSIGQNLMLSLANSMMQSALDMLAPTIDNIGTFLISGFRKVFGIASPSKIFAEFGYENIRGLVNGMTDNRNLVQDSMLGLRSIIDNELGSIEPSVKPMFDLASIKAQFSMASMFATPQLMALNTAGAGAGAGMNITVTNINAAPDTKVESTQTRKANGSVEIENMIISTVSKNVNQGGAIRQSIVNSGNRVVRR